MKHKKRLHLNLFAHATGHHIAAWRHPDSAADAGANFRHYMAIAQLAEAAKFDAIFLADNLAVPFTKTDVAKHQARYVAIFEPITLLSALASVTNHIGLIATASTTYNEPFHVARKYASLDWISHGRAGWNLVTSSSSLEAANFTSENHLPHAERYARAREFATIVTGLWDSWEDDAFVRDKASGLFFDPDKLHVLDHRSENFSVRGPLNIARSPQGRPVVVQAGSSEAGMELAAETAEVVFTAQPNIAVAQRFYADLKARVSRHGRDPSTLRILPGVSVIVGSTRQEADDKYHELRTLVQPAVGLALLSEMLGVDLRGLPVDGYLPDLPVTEANRSRQQLLIEKAKREHLTIRQLYEDIAGSRGHLEIRGTGQDVADQLEAWLLGEAADGFNYMPPTLPGSLNDFVRYVIPELQRRGIFRTEYEGHTLRSNLGLPYPINSYAQ